MDATDALNAAYAIHRKAKRPSTNTPEDNEYEALAEGFNAGIRYARGVIDEEIRRM